MFKINISDGRVCEVCNRKSNRLVNFEENTVCPDCYEKLKR